MSYPAFLGLGMLAAYLVGSIPTAVWLGRMIKGVDLREHGSGNAGATNAFRVLGKRLGGLVMLIDTFKGLGAVAVAGLAGFVGLYFSHPVQISTELVFGLCAVLGHIFPLYVGFKGGKGVATMLGVAIGVHPLGALLCLGTFILVFLLSRYVSLGSLAATFVFPIVMAIPACNPHGTSELLVMFGVMVFGIVVLSHRGNIQRLMKGDENRFRLKKEHVSDE